MRGCTVYATARVHECYTCCSVSLLRRSSGLGLKLVRRWGRELALALALVSNVESRSGTTPHL